MLIDTAVPQGSISPVIEMSRVVNPDSPMSPCENSVKILLITVWLHAIFLQPWSQCMVCEFFLSWLTFIMSWIGWIVLCEIT